MLRIFDGLSEDHKAAALAFMLAGASVSPDAAEACGGEEKLVAGRDAKEQASYLNQAALGALLKQKMGVGEFGTASIARCSNSPRELTFWFFEDIKYKDPRVLLGIFR